MLYRPGKYNSKKTELSNISYTMRAKTINRGNFYNIRRI